MRYFITPSPEDISRALESWQWLPIQGKQVALVTAFADAFLNADDGVWFLDTLEGKLKHVFASMEDLQRTLSTEDGQDLYLFGPFVDRWIREGKELLTGQCFDFIVHPVLGGKIDYSNIECTDFVVALNLRGQLHDQVRQLPPGARISKVTIDAEKPTKRRWKFR